MGSQRGGRKFPLVCGVGISDADYVLQRKEKQPNGSFKLTWMCPYYDRWVSMLQRAYSERFHKEQSKYRDCSVCEDWKTFSVFRTWMETQNWEGRELDKDILKRGNRTYSPETCVFVHSIVNCFIIEQSKRATTTTLIGAGFNKRTGKFTSRCQNPFTGEREWLGTYATELDAHLAWKRRKHELACELADSNYVDDERVAEALRNRYLLGED